MASLTTNLSLPKRLKTSTIEALNEEPARTKVIGTFVLPAGIESACGMMSNILQYLDIRSVLNVKESCLIKQLRKEFGSNDFERVRNRSFSTTIVNTDGKVTVQYNEVRSINEMIKYHPATQLYVLIERYKKEFPNRYGDLPPTPFVCACEKGRMYDVQVFVTLHPFHKYIRNRSVHQYDSMELHEMVNKVGGSRLGYNYTPLMIAAGNKHLKIVRYLIEQCKADPNIVGRDGANALHCATCNLKDIEMIELLLPRMSASGINQKKSHGYTPMDYAHRYNYSETTQAIVALVRSYGGKFNRCGEL